MSILIAPNDEKKILLHCCCAPCSGGIIERLLESNIIPTVFFYNPNIYPQNEYEIRKKEIIGFCKKKNVSFIDADFDQENWMEKVAGLENEPERGKRCEQCFNLRLTQSAQQAKENSILLFATSLGISRYKDLEQVKRAGKAAAQECKILFWDVNWRKDGGQDLATQITKQENFYKQKYCGCIYSLNENKK